MPAQRVLVIDDNVANLRLADPKTFGAAVASFLPGPTGGV